MDKIKSELKSKINHENSHIEEAKDTITAPEEEQTQTIQVNNQPETNNPNISVQTNIDPEKEEIIRKETELEIKERELEEKEEDLIHKEIDFKEQQEQLEYKPELPNSLSTIDPEKSLIIFNEGDLSFGSTALTNKKFHLKSNPDEKKSMHEFWIDNASTQSEVYLVEFKKIGTLVFDPFQGTTVFQGTTEIMTPDDFKTANEYLEGLNPEEAVESQIPAPEEEMIDSINPIVDVSQQMFNSDDFKKQELENSLKGMVEKIIQDELNKRNIFQP